MNIKDVFHNIITNLQSKTVGDVGKYYPYFKICVFGGEEFLGVYEQIIDSPSLDVWSAVLLHCENDSIKIFSSRREEFRFYHEKLFEEMWHQESLKRLGK